MKLTNKEKLFLAVLAHSFYEERASEPQRDWANTLIEKLVMSADGEMGLFYWSTLDDIFAMDEAEES